MTARRFLLMVACCLAITAVTGRADAQRRRVRQPNLNRPALSPWLNMFNRDTGPLDNYHTYVRPELRLNQTLQRQQSDLLMHGTEIQTLNQQQLLTQPGRISPTGTGSVFMDYSHFYPNSRSRRGR